MSKRKKKKTGDGDNCDGEEEKYLNDRNGTQGEHLDILEDNNHFLVPYPPGNGDGFTAPAVFPSSFPDGFLFAAYILDAVQQMYGPLLGHNLIDLVEGHTFAINQDSEPGDVIKRNIIDNCTDSTTVATSRMRRVEILHRLFPDADTVHLQTLIGMIEFLGREEFQTQLSNLIHFVFAQSPDDSDHQQWPLQSIDGISPSAIESSFRTLYDSWAPAAEQEQPKERTGNSNINLTTDGHQYPLVAVQDGAGKVSAMNRPHSAGSATKPQEKNENRKRLKKPERKRHECPSCGNVKIPVKGQKGGPCHVCPDTMIGRYDNGQTQINRKVATRIIYEIEVDKDGKQTRGRILSKETEYILPDLSSSIVRHDEVNLTTNAEVAKNDSGSQTMKSFLRDGRDNSVAAIGQKQGKAYVKVSVAPCVVASMPSQPDGTKGPTPDPVLQDWMMHPTNTRDDPIGDDGINADEEMKDIEKAGNSSYRTPAAESLLKPKKKRKKKENEMVLIRFLMVR
jgi:hypothetical protein